MRKPDYPTSIRLAPDLKRKLRYQAEKEGRRLKNHIVFILEGATALVRVPAKWTPEGQGQEKEQP